MDPRISKPLHVIFGTGPVGLAVAEELTPRGYRVRLVNRSGRTDFGGDAELVPGDASDPDFAQEVCQGASVVYNCTNVPYGSWADLLPPLQMAILQGAASAGARLVAMDNLYMYGPTDGKPITEDHPYGATSKKGKIRAQMARDLLEAHREGIVAVAIGRASDFFGPRALLCIMGERVFYPILEGKPAQILGNPDLPHTLSYIPDVARGLVVLAERDEALGRAWHLPAPETVTPRQFLEIVSEEVGRPVRIRSASRRMVQFLGLFRPILREFGEIFYQFDEPFVMDHGKFEKTFGARATPLRDAVRRTVEWFRRNPR